MAETIETTTPETTPSEPAAQPAEPVSQRPVKPALFDEPAEPVQPEDTTPATTDTPPTETPNPTETTPDTQPTPELTAQDITLPEGMTYDEELSNSFIGLLNDSKLSRKELGQKLFDLYHSQSVKLLDGLKAAEAERAKKFEADMAAEKAEWLKQCEGDAEYGGQNWEASQAIIDRACRQICTPECTALLQRYNLNTHPEIVRMYVRVGKLISEDSSQIAGNGAGKPKDAAMAIFGESLKEYHKRKREID